MKRILLYRWKAYNYIDIRETFLQLGYEIDEVNQKLENYDVDEAFAQMLEERLRSTDYEFVFSVNYFALISNVCEKCKVLYVSWSCDNPLISMYHKSVFNECNRIFTFDKTNYLEFAAMGVHHIYYLSLAVDTERIRHILEEADDLSLYHNEISFVGSLYERNSYDRIAPTLTEYQRGYFESLMLAQSDLYGTNIVERMLTPEILFQLEEKFQLDKSQDSMSDLGLIFATTTLGFKIAQLQRKKSLMDLSKQHKVSIYSNSDTSQLLRVQYRGSVEYWTQMPKVFYGSDINLNFTIPNIKSGIPLRMWDVLGAGGFLLTNFQAETPMYFDEGHDLVSFYNEEDLLRKADYYMEHPNERKQIAINGQQKVRKYHSYQIRMEELLRILRDDKM